MTDFPDIPSYDPRSTLDTDQKNIENLYYQFLNKPEVLLRLMQDASPEEREILWSVHSTIMTYKQFSNLPFENKTGFSQELIAGALKQIPLILKAQVSQLYPHIEHIKQANQERLQREAKSKTPSKKAIEESGGRVEKYTPKMSLDELSGKEVLNFCYSNLGEAFGYLAKIKTYSRIPCIPFNYFMFSVGLPNTEGTQPLTPSQREELTLPELQNSLPYEHAHVVRIPCKEHGVLPMPLGSELVAIECYNFTGQKMLQECITVTENAVGYKVECPGMTHVIYEFAPNLNGGRRKKLTEFLEQAISTQPLPSDLHPTILKKIAAFKDTAPEARPWETPPEIATRFLKTGFPEANIHENNFYSTGYFANSLLKIAHERGVLDVCMSIFPVMSCSFYANFYARLLNALGIPAFVVSCYTPCDINVNGRNFQAIPMESHNMVASLYQGGLHLFDPTSTKNLFCEVRTCEGHLLEGKQQTEALLKRVFNYLKSEDFTTKESLDALVLFLKQQFLQLVEANDRLITKGTAADLANNPSQLREIKINFCNPSTGIDPNELLLEKNPRYEILKALSLKERTQLLREFFENYRIKKMVQLPDWASDQIHAADDKIKKLLEAVNKRYQATLTLEPITQLVQRKEEVAVSFLTAKLLDGEFSPNWSTPFPCREQPNLGDLALRTNHLYERTLEFIEKFGIREGAWSRNTLPHKNIPPNELSLLPETLQPFFNNMSKEIFELLIFYLPSTFTSKDVPVPDILLKAIQDTYLLGELDIIRSLPDFQEKLNALGSWIKNHCENRELMIHDTHLFYLEWLFQEGTPVRTQLELFSEALLHFIFPTDPKENTLRLKTELQMMRTRFHTRIQSLLEGYIGPGLDKEYLESILDNYEAVLFESIGKNPDSMETLYQAKVQYCANIMKILEKRDKFSRFKAYFVGRNTKEITDKSPRPFYYHSVSVETIKETAKSIFSSPEGTPFIPSVYRNPKQLLRKLETECFVGPLVKKQTGGGDPVDYKESPKGRKPLLREDIDFVYFEAYSNLNSSFQRLQLSLGKSDALPLDFSLTQQDNAEFLQIIRSIPLQPDAEETHPVKTVLTQLEKGEPLWGQDIKNILHFLGQASTKYLYKTPIYEDSSSSHRGDLVCVDLNELLEHPEKTRVLFNFLTLKQETKRSKEPLEVTLYFCGIKLESFNLDPKKHPLKKEIADLFNFKNNWQPSIGAHPTGQSFVQVFFEYYTKAAVRKTNLSEVFPENKFPVPKISSGKNITIFASLLNWAGALKQLQPVNLRGRGKPFMVAK